MCVVVSIIKSNRFLLLVIIVSLDGCYQRVGLDSVDGAAKRRRIDNVM